MTTIAVLGRRRGGCDGTVGYLDEVVGRVVDEVGRPFDQTADGEVEQQLLQVAGDVVTGAGRHRRRRRRRRSRRRRRRQRRAAGNDVHSSSSSPASSSSSSTASLLALRCVPLQWLKKNKQKTKKRAEGYENASLPSLYRVFFFFFCCGRARHQPTPPGAAETVGR